MKPGLQLVRDPIKWALFEIGAGYYTRKLATGPEADLRQDFVEWLDLPQSKRSDGARSILDVGCGPGHVTRALARRGHALTGVDRSPRLVRIAKRWTRREGLSIRFERSPGEKLPFKDRTFDGAFTTGVIYFVEHPLRTLREMVRVIRPGGFIASLDPHESMSTSLARDYSRESRLSRRDTRKLVTWAITAEMNRRFKEEDLRALLAKAGLSNVTLERRMGGMVWFSRGVVTGRA